MGADWPVKAKKDSFIGNLAVMIDYFHMKGRLKGGAWRANELLDRLWGHLRESDFKPGDRIETTAQLAKRFGVSRARMRDVMTTLCQLGILDSRPGRGTVLMAMDPAEVAQHLALHFAHGGFEPADALEARALIEEAILPLVIRRINPSLLGALRETIVRLEESGGRAPQVDEADRDFHLLLLQATGNRCLQIFAQFIVEVFRQLYPNPTPDHDARTLDEHRRLLKAIEDEDLPAARETLREHLKAAASLMRAQLDQERKKALQLPQ